MRSCISLKKKQKKKNTRIRNFVLTIPEYICGLNQNSLYDNISFNDTEFVQGILCSNTISRSFSSFEFSLLVTVIGLD